MRVAPVPGFCTVIFASGIARPEGSVMRPDISEFWASKEVVSHR